MRRTHCNGELRKEHIGKSVVLCGWVHARRDHGGILFIDLRDRTGFVQIVFRPESKDLFSTADQLGLEYVIEVSGKVSQRPPETENTNIPTGSVEVIAASLSILNTSKPSPFEISDFGQSSEEVRLCHRFLDLRRPKPLKNIVLRHNISQAIRAYFCRKGFLEIETPFLIKSTPEGARDFLVPCRLQMGSFYALPQSPQLFKQTLMVAGFDRYFQLARCFRDEDLRADRQPEFTQIDVEMSFVQEDDVMETTEEMLAEVFRTVRGETLSLPFQRLTYSESVRRFGSDKPDLRYAEEICDLTEIFRGSKFKVFSRSISDGGVVRVLRAPGAAALSRQELEGMAQRVRPFGLQGLAYIKFSDTSKPESPIVKFLNEDELAGVRELVKVRPGDVVFFAAAPVNTAARSLGFLRQYLAKKLSWSMNSRWAFTWVYDFPLLEWDNEARRWISVHHPFTAPREEDVRFLDDIKNQITPDQKTHFDVPRARAYDIVLNGYELGGGSIRIHKRILQEKMFSILGISQKEAVQKFGFLLEALEYGAPPHGGIALGLDRFVSLLAEEDNIREVIAFPKTQKGICPLSGAPSVVTDAQLLELGLKNVGIPPKATSSR